eukprot:191614_1
MDCSISNAYSICNIDCIGDFSCEETIIEGRNSINTNLQCLGDYSCYDSNIDCSDRNHLSECIIDCFGNYSCGLTSIDGLFAEIVDIECNENNSCRFIRFDCMDTDVLMDSECLINCNKTNSCYMGEIRGQNASKLDIKCNNDLSCDSINVICPNKQNSECLIECGIDSNIGSRQCYNGFFSGSESWNFTIIMNGNRSGEMAEIRGEASMNEHLMKNPKFDVLSDDIFENNITESLFYWMNIIVNGMYGFNNGKLLGDKRDKIFVECNHDYSCYDIEYKVNAFSNGYIDCDKESINVCNNGEYYCRDYIMNDRECIDNGVIFLCDHSNLDCDIQFQIFYPTLSPTRAPNIQIITSNIKDSTDESILYKTSLFFYFIAIALFAMFV